MQFGKGTQKGTQETEKRDTRKGTQEIDTPYIMNIIQVFKKDSRKQGGWGHIKLRMSWDNQRVELGTGHCIQVKHWDTNRKEIKKLSAVSDIRTDLQLQTASLIKQWNQLHAQMESFTAQDFKSFRRGDLNPKTGTKMDFLPWVANFIECFDTTPLPGSSKAGSHASKKKYKSDLTILEHFSLETGEALTWENMDHQFCRKMREWRASKPANAFRPGYADTTRTSEGTIGRWVKTVRGWISRARNEGIHTFDHHKHPEWTVREADVLRFALSQKQVLAFFEWDVPDAPNGGGERTGVKKARDLFCVQCTTGVRVSDLPQIIDQYNSNPNRETFTVHMKKTDSGVTIPVMDLVHKVAERHGGKLPALGALPRFNKLLRKGAELSGLFTETMLKPVLDENGHRVLQEVKQSQLVTSHAARRTFATYLVGKGVPTRTVMSMTGHKVESEFHKYVNMNATETALKVKELAGF